MALKDIIQGIFVAMDSWQATQEIAKKQAQDRIQQIQYEITFANSIEGAAVMLKDGTSADKATWIVEQQTEIAVWQAIIDRI